jgi:hypothetical protein
MNDWQSCTEVCFGRLLSGKENMKNYHKDMFTPPYNEGFEILRDTFDKTLTMNKIGISAFQTAKEAAASIVEDDLDVKWNILLRNSANLYRAGEQAENWGKMAKRGDNVTIKVSDLVMTLSSVTSGKASTFVPMSSVDISNYQPLIECGYYPVDKYLGGITEAGAIIVNGATGHGKSFLCMKIVHSYLTRYPDRIAMYYTPELTEQEFKYRATNNLPIPDEMGNRWLIKNSRMDITEYAIEAAALGAKICVIDYIDYLVNNQDPSLSTAAYSSVAMRCNEIATNLGITLIVVTQPSRSAQYDAVMSINASRQSGMMENIVRQYWTIARPDDDDAAKPFIYEENKMYLVAWKNPGWPHNPPGVDGGAIVVTRDRKCNGWGGDGLDAEWQVKGVGGKKKKKNWSD